VLDFSYFHVNQDPETEKQPTTARLIGRLGSVSRREAGASLHYVTMRGQTGRAGTIYFSYIYKMGGRGDYIWDMHGTCTGHVWGCESLSRVTRPLLMI
jgi:hypothetical protein